MPEPTAAASRRQPLAMAATVVLLVLTAVMLAALLTRTPPHPPLEVPPFALGPFLGASLALGAAALLLLRDDAPGASTTMLLFVATALISFGPQKYVDPAFPRIWPAVIVAQLAIVVLVVSTLYRLREKRHAAR